MSDVRDSYRFALLWMLVLLLTLACKWLELVFIRSYFTLTVHQLGPPRLASLSHTAWTSTETLSRLPEIAWSLVVPLYNLPEVSAITTKNTSNRASQVPFLPCH